MCKTISPFFYYSELKRYERKKSFIGHQYIAIQWRKSMFKTLPINLITKSEKGMLMTKHVL